MPKHLISFVCAGCGKPVTAVLEEEPGEYPVCPHCMLSQKHAPEQREITHQLRDNQEDTFQAFKACCKIAGQRKAFDVLIEWADSALHSRIAVDLWDAAIPTGEPPQMPGGGCTYGQSIARKTQITN